MRLDAGDFAADHRERAVELRQIRHHEEQAAEGQRTRLHVRNADHERERGASSGRHANEPAEDVLHKREADPS